MGKARTKKEEQKNIWVANKVLVYCCLLSGQAVKIINQNAICCMVTETIIVSSGWSEAKVADVRLIQIEIAYQIATDEINKA